MLNLWSCSRKYSVMKQTELPKKNITWGERGLFIEHLIVHIQARHCMGCDWLLVNIMTERAIIILQLYYIKYFYLIQIICKIWPIDETLTGFTIRGGSESNGNEGVLHITRCSLVSYSAQDNFLWRGVLPLHGSLFNSVPPPSLRLVAYYYSTIYSSIVDFTSI